MLLHEVRELFRASRLGISDRPGSQLKFNRTIRGRSMTGVHPNALYLAIAQRKYLQRSTPPSLSQVFARGRGEVIRLAATDLYGLKESSNGSSRVVSSEGLQGAIVREVRCPTLPPCHPTYKSERSTIIAQS
jgi:hypothetical protein